MAITKERKQELVALYTDLLERSQALILTNYQGLNVADLTKLRNQVREAKGVYYVTKNTLFKLALAQKGLQAPPEWLEGPTAVGFCFEDAPAVAKVLVDLAGESESLAIKGAFLGDQAVDPKRVKALASLPPMDVLKSQVLGTFMAPMSGVAGVLNGLLAGLVGVLDARHAQLGEAEAA